MSSKDEELHRTRTKDPNVKLHIIDELCCAKCKKTVYKSESLQEVGKGIQTLVKYPIKVNNNVLEKYLLETKTSNTRVKIRLSEECI